MDSSNHLRAMDSLTNKKYFQPFTDNVVTKSATLKWTCVEKVTKFSLYLVILLCAISVQTSNAIPVQASGQRLSLHTQQYRERRYQQLLQEQRSLVVPTPHKHHLHHRSVGIMPQTNSRREDTNANGNDVGDYCRVIETTKDLIDTARQQANAAFSTFYDFLGTYTQKQHNETLENFYEQWSKHSLQLKHPHADIINRNINVMRSTKNAIPPHLKGDVISEKNIQTEFLNINQTLRILKDVYEEKNKSRKKDKSYNFDLRRENESEEQFQERLKIINQMYVEGVYSLNQDLYHTGKILERLNIEPQSDFTVSYDENAQQIEWLLFQEHLGVMKYLTDVYTYLLEHCSKAS